MLFDWLFRRKAAHIESIDAAEAVGLHGRAGVIFVDVRGEDEIARSGTIAGALRLPLPRLAALAKPKAGVLPPAKGGQRLILVCASGIRSRMAAKQLSRMGYVRLASLEGGFGQWLAKGGPTER